jgi:hypothetical protein
VRGVLHTDIGPTLEPGSHVLYLGDFDLCGNDIESNTRSVLERETGKLEWERLALSEEQIERHNLPRIIKTDRRFKDGGGRHEAVETEALSQRFTNEIVAAHLDELLPESLESVQERKEREREVTEGHYSSRRKLHRWTTTKNSSDRSKRKY